MAFKGPFVKPKALDCSGQSDLPGKNSVVCFRVVRASSSIFWVLRSLFLSVSFSILPAKTSSPNINLRYCNRFLTISFFLILPSCGYFTLLFCRQQ